MEEKQQKESTKKEREKRWMNEWINVACVASVSNRVIAQKLERKQKKVEGGGGGGGEKRKRLPANPSLRADDN